MEITLTPEMEKLIDEEMKAGDYFSPTDVLREGLLSLRARRIPKKERLENLRREIQKGIDDIQEGRYKTYNADNLDEFVEEIIERGKEKLNKRNGEK